MNARQAAGASSADVGSAVSPARTQVFYRFTDSEGRLHIVDSPNSIPEAFRTQAERIELGSHDASEWSRALPAGLELRSFAFGFLFACVLALGFVLVRKRSGLL